MPNRKREERKYGIIRWRTISPKPGVFIHVGIRKTKGPRGGRTIAFALHYKGKKKVKQIQ